MNTLATSTFFAAYSGSDLFGKMIFLGLILLSIVSWIFIIYQVWIVRLLDPLAKKYAHLFQNSNDQLLTKPIESLPALPMRDLQNPFIQIFLSFKNKTGQLLEKNLYFAKQTGEKTPRVYLSEKDIDLLESHALITLNDQIKQLEKNLYILSTIAPLAPFLGLLGTVWGILQTFSGMQSGLAITSNNAVLAGLATALTTTVLGLLIAIPALVGNNYLRSRFRALSSDMEGFLYNLLSTLELQYRKVDLPT